MESSRRGDMMFESVYFLGVWISLAFTVMIMSFGLYKENRLFRFAEYTAVATSLGNGVIVALRYIQSTFFDPAIKLGGFDTLYLVAIVFAGLLFLQYHSDYKWVARYPLAILVGVGLGVAARASLQTDVVKQVYAAMAPIGGLQLDIANGIISLVITVIVMAYFLMTPKYTGKASYLLKTAQVFLFIMFGALLASGIPTYVAWASGRVHYILQALGILK